MRIPAFAASLPFRICGRLVSKFLPRRLPHPIKLLRKPALFQKLQFQLPELLVEQVVGLVDQADQGVGGDEFSTR